MNKSAAWSTDYISACTELSCARRGLLVVGFFALTALPAHASDKIEYIRDIRPILMENCFACHGPDSAARKAKLRLDQGEAAHMAGVLSAGEPSKSEVIRRITAVDPREQMPPPQAHKKLTAAQKKMLETWIAEGAKYQPHWSFIKPSRPVLPKVKNVGWIRNPIDHFILARLESAELAPAQESDRRKLARRVSLDLTGLPPNVADLETFVNDAAPDAYERFVDRLLASPHWGEHRGRYWLDYARYADTHGLHFDNYREMWAYRDWVMQAFNANMPFDQFTIEQLAGDLLPSPTLDQLIATGFNRCNVTTNEGGTIVEENLVHYTRDRTETVAQVWLGLTANCAVCHDHKYDDLPTRDFYSMSAFFNNTTQKGLDDNIANTPPIIFVPRGDDRPRWTTLPNELAAMNSKIAAHKKTVRGEFENWLTVTNTQLLGDVVPTTGLRLYLPLDEGTGKRFHFTLDGKPRSVELESGFDWSAGHIAPKAMSIKAGKSIELTDVGDFEKNQTFSCGIWVKPPKGSQTGALVSRMDNTKMHRGWDVWIENNRIGMHIINEWPANAIKVLAKTAVPTNKWSHVTVSYDGSAKAAGVIVYVNGVAQELEVFADQLSQSIRTTVPFKVGERFSANRLPPGVALQDLRLHGRALPALEVEQIARGTRASALLAKSAELRTPQEITEIFDWWLPANNQPYRDLRLDLMKLQREESLIRSRGANTHVMQERKVSPEAYILDRGEYNKRKDKVQAATPGVLPPMSPELPSNRLGFAKWLFLSEHPLTARVTVNRYWQEVFCNGLVRTAGDFGVSGELPSHPELLDWLAVEFRESGWDVKRLFKLLVTSATYRQAAVITKEKLAIDPQNLLLSRGPRARMDAEMIRDQALAASGLLVPKLGGPSVKPYQPPGVWEAVAMPESNTKSYKIDTGENLYRRSLYTFWKRGAPPAAMDILNSPSREFCIVQRERTNTPQQALVTMNDPQFVEAARHLAQVALRVGTTFETRLEIMTTRLLARLMKVEEQKVVRSLVDDLLKHYQAHPAEAQKLIRVGESRPDALLDVPTLAAWTIVANQLMNLDEALAK